jgi:hypothetical protein
MPNGWNARVPNMFLGVGPGRCGTESLAQILNTADGVRVTHENYPTTDRLLIDSAAMLSQIREGTEDLIGWVGTLWLTFVHIVRIQFPEIPVLCLHRDRDAVVRSFMNRQRVRGGLPWIINIQGVVPELTPGYLVRHWEWAEAQMSHIRPPVLHLDVEDLNDNVALAAIYDFLRVPDACRSFPEKRRYRVGLESAPMPGDYKPAMERVVI